jgi:hypothetical protein
MVTITVERVIAADPTSTALLLAGPTAFDLWPGVTRVGPGVVSALVPALAAHEATVRVRALPPRRLPTAYVTRFGFSADALPETDGTVTLAYAPGHDVPVATCATLTLTWDGDALGADRSRVAAAFHAMACGFLDNLANAAEERADAA